MGDVSAQRRTSDNKTVPAPLRALGRGLTITDLRVDLWPRHMRFAHVGNRRYVIRHPLQSYRRFKCWS